MEFIWACVLLLASGAAGAPVICGAGAPVARTVRTVVMQESVVKGGKVGMGSLTSAVGRAELRPRHEAMMMVVKVFMISSCLKS